MKLAVPALLSLALLSACGGGGGGPAGPSAASALSYANPTATTGYRLVQNAATTPTHLVLDLVGPAGTQTKGVAVFLAVDTTRATWSPAGGPYVSAGSVIPLGAAPQMLAAKVQLGALQVGLFQKGGAATTLTSAPIFTVALDLASGATTGAVTLVPQTGRTCQSLGADGTLAPITVNVGTLAAR